MATRLYQVIPIVNLAPATPTVYPTALNESDTPVLPDIVVKHPDLSIVYTTTQITVTNNGAAPVTFDLLLERIHSIPRELGALPNLTPQPYEINASPGAVAAGGGFVPQGGPAILGVDTGKVIWVNPQAADAADDGNVDTPKLTIQGAINAIPAPTSTEEQDRTWMIFVATGVYQEDLVMPQFGMRLTMAAFGKVTVNSVLWQPGGGAPEFGNSFLTFCAFNRGFNRDQTLINLNFNEGWTVLTTFTMEGPVVPAVGVQNLSIQDTVVYNSINVIDGGGGVDILAQTNFFMRNARSFGTMNITASGSKFVYGEQMACDAICTVESFGSGSMDGCTIGTVVVGGGSNGRWTNCRLNAFTANAGTNGPFMDQLTHQRLVDQGAPLMARGPRPTEPLYTIGVWGAGLLDTLAAVYIQPGYAALSAISLTPDFGVGACNQRTVLAGIVARVNRGVGSGADVTVEALINGVVAGSVVVDSATVNQADIILDPMVLIPADAVIDVRATPAADLVDGNLNLTVRLLGY